MLAQQRLFGYHVNAFEEGNDVVVDVVVDVVAFPDSGVIDQLYLERLRSTEPLTATGKLTRFRIGSSGDATDETLSEARIEFPRINCRTTISLRLRGRQQGAGELHRQPGEAGPRA
jgi:carotenoid cleavage dioxygenase-like enzyme